MADTPYRCPSCKVPVYTSGGEYCSGGFQFCFNRGPQYSKMLRWALDAGLVVVCSMAPYEGQPVTYDPGYSGTHPRPWVLPGTGLRYYGRECHALPQPPKRSEPATPGRRRWFGR
jgi:hypothetical protein